MPYPQAIAAAPVMQRKRAMSNRDHRPDEDTDVVAPIAQGRAKEIPWAHPSLSHLSEAARLIYACLVDGRSDTARATLRGVDVVWRNRYSDRKKQLLDREAFDEICFALQELLGSGLVILRDETTVQTAWVRRPWLDSLLN
jgi:hypothetical protein